MTAPQTLPGLPAPPDPFALLRNGTLGGKSAGRIPTPASCRRWGIGGTENQGCGAEQRDRGRAGRCQCHWASNTAGIPKNLDFDGFCTSTWTQLWGWVDPPVGFWVTPVGLGGSTRGSGWVTPVGFWVTPVGLGASQLWVFRPHLWVCGSHLWDWVGHSCGILGHTCGFVCLRPARREVWLQAQDTNPAEEETWSKQPGEPKFLLSPLHSALSPGYAARWELGVKSICFPKKNPTETSQSVFVELIS